MVKCAACGSELDVISSTSPPVFVGLKEYPKGFRIEMDGAIYEVVSTEPHPHQWAGIVHSLSKVNTQGGKV